MQIDFKALEQALAPIAKIGQGELTFDAGPTTITLRVLLPLEEIEAQKFAAGALNEADEGEHTAVDYIDRFRLACLSHSVISVGEMDFRDTAFIETGEKLEDGTPVKITKHKAVRRLIRRWTRSTLTAVFAKFNELVKRTENEAEEQIEYEPSNLPAEIDRLQKRMDELKEQIEHDTAVEKTKFSDKVETLARSEAEGVEVIPDPDLNDEDKDEDEVKTDPTQLMNPARRTGPITPHSAPPPSERQIQVPESAAVAASPQQQHREPPRADSSFINMDDDDEVNAALDAEHNRIAAMRRRAAAGQPPSDDGSALQAIHPQTTVRQRRPPHLDAREAEADIGVLDGAHQAAQQVGEIDGKPVFDLGTQTLGAKAPVTPRKAPINPPAGGSKNPRFTPRKKS